jgi:hypothetical protein
MLSQGSSRHSTVNLIPTAARHPSGTSNGCTISGDYMVEVASENEQFEIPEERRQVSFLTSSPMS